MIKAGYLNVGIKGPLFLFVGVLTLLPIVSPPFALLGGFLFSITLGIPWGKQVSQFTKVLLKASVVGLGFGMNLQQAIQTGKEGLCVSTISVLCTIMLGLGLARIFKLEKQLGILITVGTAICGGSAIAAVASSMKARPGAVTLSLGVVFFLNSIALFLFPAIGNWLGLSQHTFGLWSAIAIHDTSSVVGAAATYGKEALELATTVKLVRSLWIIPIAFLAGMLLNKRAGKSTFPWFILFFVGAMCLRSLLPDLTSAYDSLYFMARRFLVLTLFLIGSQLSLEVLKEAGMKPILFGVLLWLCISSGSLIALI